MLHSVFSPPEVYRGQPYENCTAALIDKETMVSMSNKIAAMLGNMFDLVQKIGQNDYRQQW